MNKKIIYLNIEVTIGQTINFNGLKVIVSQELIDNNPQMFSIIEDKLPEFWKCVIPGTNFTKNRIYKIVNINNLEDGCNFISDTGTTNGWQGENYKHFTSTTEEEYIKQELLNKAIKDYPKGTRFKDVHPNPEKGIQIVTDYRCDESIIWGTHIENTMYASSCIYYCGKWAEIVKPILITEDGVNIYEGDTYWYVQTGPNNGNTNAISKYIWEVKEYSGNSNDIIDLFNTNIKRFSTKTLAEAYIESKKEGTLEDYENLLLNKPSITFSNRLFYKELRKVEPKLYWIKVLQLIADRLNGDWKPPVNSGERTYTIDITMDKNYNCCVPWGEGNSGKTAFKSQELAEKAIQIIGKENLNKIYLNN